MYLECYNGFRSYISATISAVRCFSQVLELSTDDTNDLFKALDIEMLYALVLLDLSSAFDNVDYSSSQRHNTKLDCSDHI